MAMGANKLRWGSRAPLTGDMTRFCFSRQLYVVRLVRIALECHFGVIPYD